MLKEGIDYKFIDGILSVQYNGKWQTIQDDTYIMKEVIAAGANGVTIKGFNELTNRYVAIKVWKPRDNNFQKYIEKYEMEIKKISKVNLPQVAHVYYGKVIKNYGIMVMEYIDGICLKEWLKQNNNYIRRINLCIKILEAVIQYQKQGIIHGDLHGGNILITSDDEIHIIDFGTSHLNGYEYSVKRESRLVFETIKSILKGVKYFDDQHIAIKVAYNDILIDNKKIGSSELEKLVDCFKINPVLLSQTLLSYVNIIKVMQFITNMDIDIMKEICNYISQTQYLNLTSLLDTILIKVEKNKIQMFFNILFSHIETSVFPEYFDPTWKNIEYYKGDLYIISANVYYDIIQCYSLSVGNIEDYDEIIVGNEIKEEMGAISRNLNCCLRSNFNFYAYLNTIDDDLNFNVYFERTRELLNLCLNSYFKNIKPYYLYWLNTMINTYYWDEKIKEKSNTIKVKLIL